MKKMLAVMTMVLGLVMCLSTVSQAQPSPEWGQTKQLALSGSFVSESGICKRSFSQGDCGWHCFYDKRGGICWQKICYEKGVLTTESMAFGEATGKFWYTVAENKVTTKNYSVSYEEGIRTGKQFINEMKAQGFIR